MNNARARPRHSSQADVTHRWHIAIGLSIAGGLFIALATFSVIFPLVETMPKWDQWTMVEVFEAHYGGRPVLPLLVKPYNGHLNVLPRCFFFALGLLTHWNVRAEVIASFVVAIGTAILLLAMLRDTNPSMLVLAAPIVGYVFSLAQYENFMSGYPFGQNLSQTASTAVVFLLSRPQLRTREVALAAGAALVATFSWGAGIASVGIGLLLLLARRWPHWRYPAAWAAGAASVAFLVSRPANVGIAWPRVPGFFVRLLAPVFAPSAFLSVEQASFWSWLTVLIFLSAVLVAWYRAPRLDFQRWSALGATALSSALFIALGRASAAPSQALASHYVTTTYPVAVAALALFSRALIPKQGTRLRPTSLALLVVLTLLPLAQLTKVARRTLPELRAWHVTNVDASAKLLRGTATDEEIHRTLHPNAALVRRGAEILRAHGLAAFAR